jgi:hypothetical protein
MPRKYVVTGARAACRLWFIGSLPPPLNGQSNCNVAMHARLSEAADIEVLPLGIGMYGKIRRSFLNAAILLARARRGDIGYISVPGQAGVWLMMPAVAALRLRGIAPWFHHHSFRAINRGPLRSMAMLVRAGGPHQRHILLSERMRDRFAAIYAGARRRA